MSNIAERLSARLAERYHIKRELGAGGMATVFLAEDLKHHRQVAIKVLHPDLGAILGAERFLSEIRTTANLQHPHILPLHDSGEADGLLFYVMPFVSGATLREQLRRDGPLPIDDALRIATDIAGALDHAHRHGVIHRDIKPENIFIQDGQALVADFGIALAVTSAGGQRMTTTGISLGTPEYMSPEQALGERSITAKADVYALGCVLYEMLTGQPPFTGSTLQAIVAKTLQDRPVAPSVLRDSVPSELSEVVMAALAKLPADRIQSAAAFKTALTAPGSLRKTTAAVPPAKPTTRNAARPWQLASAVFAIVAIAGWGRASLGPSSEYRGPKGCEAQDGVWRHVGAGMSGTWITHNGYGLEVLFRKGATVPEFSSWRMVRCTDTTTTSIYLGSTLSGGDSVLQTGAEVTSQVRIEEGIMIWRNPDKTGVLGPELRGERIR